MDFAEAARSITAGDRWAVSEPGHFNRTFVRGIVETGVPFLPPDRFDENAAFEEVRSWLQWAAEPHAAANAVYMDTTTLTSVAVAIEEREILTATNLLDLAMFAENVILFDTIVHLENRDLDSLTFNERLGGNRIVLALPVLKASPALSLFLEQSWDRSFAEVGDMLDARDRFELHYEERAELIRTWAILLDVPEIDQAAFVEAHHEVGNIGWPSEGRLLLERLVESMHFPSEMLANFESVPAARRYELAAESNYRAAFNQAISYALRLPYTPNTLRVPITRWRMHQSSSAQAALMAGGVLNRALRDRLALFPTFADSPPLPFFLTAILARIGTLNEFYEVLLELRDAAQPLRNRRAALETALQQGRGREARELTSAIAADTRALRVNLLRAGAGGIAAFLAAVVQAPLGTAIAGIGILTAISQAGGGDYEAIANRLFNPTWAFLHDTTQMAMDLGNVAKKIETLWKLGPFARQIERHLTRLAALPGTRD